MTIFGWDTSHYDYDRGSVDLRAAKADGMVFVTAKIGEGSSNTDPRFDDTVTRARDAGIEFIGAYYVVHTTNPAGQADRCIALADQLAPWWCSYPGWFWQGDFEHWPTDFPPPSACKTFCDRLVERTGRRVIAYASHGQYGDTLAGLGHPLWNANYGTNPIGHYRELYPGDGSSRWSAYSSQVPVLLQYGSNTRIGTQSTCDANAFRGSVADFRTLINGGSMATLTTDDPGWLDTLFRLDSILRMTDPAARTGEPNELAKAIRALAADVATLKSQVAVLLANAGQPVAITLTTEQLGALANALIGATRPAVEDVIGRTGLVVKPAS